QSREKLAREEKGRGRVAAVQLISHVERAANNRAQLDAVRRANGLAENRADDVTDEAEALSNRLVVDARVQPGPRRPLEEIAEGAVTAGSVLDDEHRHRGGVDPCERADAAVVVARREADLPATDLGFSLLGIGGETFVERAANDARALAAEVVVPGEWRPR